MTPRRHVTCECDPIWEEGLCRCEQVQMSSYEVREGLNPTTAVLLSGKCGHRTPRGRRPCGDRAETGTVHRQAVRHQGLPATTTSWSRHVGGSEALPAP